MKSSLSRHVVGRALLLFAILLFYDVTAAFRPNILRPERDEWWQGPTNLGHITGVAVDLSGNPVVFHRGDRIWLRETFSWDDIFLEDDRGPITENTVLTLDEVTGKILSGWGNNTFYMPHGICIDPWGNVWLTDVALHQVFKYSSTGSHLLTLGERFVPGNDNEHFCKPTAVAVAPTGEVIVADGYCNQRIVLFDTMGKMYGSAGAFLGLRVPHSVTVLANGIVCVADRENARIACINVGIGSRTYPYDKPFYVKLNGRPYGVVSHGNIVYALTKKDGCQMCPHGYTIDTRNRTVVDKWFIPNRADVDWNGHGLGIHPNGTTMYATEFSAGQFELQIAYNRVWKFLMK